MIEHRDNFRIVVIDRGWVICGDVETRAEDIVVSNARCILQWGTTKGIGELARGATSKTKHEYMGVVEVPKRAVIFQIVADREKWIK